MFSHELFKELESLITNAMQSDLHRLQKRFLHLQDQSKTVSDQGENLPNFLETYYLKLHEAAEKSSNLHEKRKTQRPRLEYPEHLPIMEHRDTIIDCLKKNQVIIVSGETGSGKSTQLPKFCLETGLGYRARIACTQPRRIAATSIAQQLAQELETKVGELVGYRIRFSEKHSPQTLIQVLTDGMLLSETRTDRFLNMYDAIILDEAHERSLNIDFILGYLLGLLQKRKDLHLIITSATIDIDKFSEAFGGTPVIEVSGRNFPVEIRNREMNESRIDAGEYTIINAMADSIHEILEETLDGDLLAFLPGEREIHDVIERLSMFHHTHSLLPLYGRLTNRDQNKIFRPSAKRKVIIATNIAETSITIPGIRFVIDSGTARISRYLPKNRTQRLKVELISQNNALQRAGRAGRIEAGVCIRLYSEETFSDMRKYSEPEILRSNLAGVILQMLTFGLGHEYLSGIERILSFPFLDPPSITAVREGFRLLEELGAIDEKKKLTQMGKQMARLPIEPQTARMLLEAHRENALREVLVIAAGLSIQDPREYPLEHKVQARQTHRKFIHPDSDYLTLLNIWDMYHEQWESLGSENKMRKFCKNHFLSFIRLREWRDIHQQLSSILKDARLLNLNRKPDYASIHRSILAGHLNCIANKLEKKRYQTAGGKEIHIFPGSALVKKPGKWILAGEQVETSRLFSRKVANIDLEWLEKLGGNLSKSTFSKPHFNEEHGTVQVFERITLYGLPIVPRRSIPYTRINPGEATSYFIKEALIAERLRTHLPFFRNNHQLKQKLVDQDAKLRRNRLHDIEAAQEAFYSKHLLRIGSIHDLNRLLKKRRAEGKRGFLNMKMEDLLTLADEEIPSAEVYPDHWKSRNEIFPLQYKFSPGSTEDGVTMIAIDDQLDLLHPSACDWLVSGHWEERILNLLKTLPKLIRRQLVPLGETAKKIYCHLKMPTEICTSINTKITFKPDCKTGSSFIHVLQNLIREHFKIHILEEDWHWNRIPYFLQPRLEIRNSQQQMIYNGHDTVGILFQRKAELKHFPKTSLIKTVNEAWEIASKAWRLIQIDDWKFELPPEVSIDNPRGQNLKGFPGLKINEESIERSLFGSKKEALQNTQLATRKLLASVAGPGLAWLERDMSNLKELHTSYSLFGSPYEMRKDLWENLLQYLFDGPWIEKENDFRTRQVEVRKKLETLPQLYLAQLESLLNSYHKTRGMIIRSTGNLKTEDVKSISHHLHTLLPKRFPSKIPFIQWNNQKRYLKAIRIRIERLLTNPEKDAEKYMCLEPWLKIVEHLQRENLDIHECSALEELSWLVEEYRVSLFAPELKTSVPISSRRLEKFTQLHFPHIPFIFTVGHY